MDSNALPYQLVIAVVVWGISVGYFWLLFLRKPTIIGFDRDWHGLLKAYERSLLLLLAPLSLLTYFICWICSGMNFGDKLYVALLMRYHRQCGDESTPVRDCC